MFTLQKIFLSEPPWSMTSPTWIRVRMQHKMSGGSDLPWVKNSKPKTWAGDKKIKVVFSSLSWPRSRLYERVLDELSMDSVAHDITEAGVQMSTDNPIWRIHNLEHDLRFTCYPVQSIIISCQPSSANPTIHLLRIPLGSIIEMDIKREESRKLWNQRQVRLPPPEVEFRRRGGSVVPGFAGNQ